MVIGAVARSSNSFSWAPDGTILIGQLNEILRVPATGGKPAVVISAQKGNVLMSPQLLPDGDTVLFTEEPAESTTIDGTHIVAQKISTGERKVLVGGGGEAHYLPTGHLVYAVGNVLMGVAVDARRLAVTRGAVRVVQGVMMTAAVTGMKAANYGVAADDSRVREPDPGAEVVPGRFPGFAESPRHHAGRPANRSDRTGTSDRRRWSRTAGNPHRPQLDRRAETPGAGEVTARNPGASADVPATSPRELPLAHRRWRARTAHGLDSAR
ncbi:MAG: hypothetical protein EXS32_17505 [Opitutus sp.]|nr:hypothetical protein [Opitutus sp.]